MKANFDRKYESFSLYTLLKFVVLPKIVACMRHIHRNINSRRERRFY